MKYIVLAVLLVFAAAATQAQQAVTYTTTDDYDDVVFSVENAIVGAGLVIDATSHVGSMLERTRADMGSDKVLFLNADVFSFCSAKISREVMEADPRNIVFCPYGIYVAELADKPGEVIVGYKVYPDGAMQKVQALLDEIVKAALQE